jgi:hypothetical protein
MPRLREDKPALRITPRVLDMALACEYTSWSPHTLRALLHKGVISRVRVPVSRNPKRECNREIFFDRLELDEAIESFREKTEAA